MRGERPFRRGLRAVLPGGRLGEELDEELQFHLERKAEARERAGLSPEKAREEAARQFGDVQRVRQECLQIDRQREREMKRREFVNGLAGDLRFSVRALRRSPGFTLTVLLT